MKKAYLALLLMLATAGLHARNDGITFRFSAKHTCTFAELDSIVMENLTQGGSQVLYYPDTVITFTATDIHTIEGIHDALYVSQNYPNPFSGKTHIDIYVPGSDQFYIKVYDLTGRQVTAYEKWLEQGLHQFAFYACNKQAYIFTVSSHMYVQKQLMIQLGTGGSAPSTIIYNGETIINKRVTLQAKAQQKSSSSEFGFNIGDEIRFTGYVTDGSGNEYHEVITDTPVTNQDYLFDIANIQPEQPSEIAGDHTVTAYETELAYEVPPVPGVTYHWTVPGDWSITSGQGEHAITANAGVASGEISVVAENACGTSPERILPVTVHVTLTLVASPADGGTVTGSGTYEEGAQVSISATANTDWEFVSWMDTTGTVVANTAEYDFVMPASNVTLTASFQQEPGTETDTFTDSRDDQVYRWVKIGDQVWMAENLKYLPAVVGPGTGSETEPHYYVYGYDGTDVSAAKATANYQNYGVLYNWTAAMEGASSSIANPSGVQGVCPTGWHVPSDAEWTQLVNYVVAQGYPNENVANGTSNALKSCRQDNSPLGGECNTSAHPRWNSHSTYYGTDAFGFSALPGGHCDAFRGGFGLIGGRGSWWSATEGTVLSAWSWIIYAVSGTVGSGDGSKVSGLSIRCLKDTSTETDTYTLNLEVSPPEAGSVQGDGEYQAGEQVSISAAANAGWEFVSWTDSTSEVVTTMAEYDFVMPAGNLTLTANFEEEDAGWPRDTETEVVEVTNPTTGKIWMDRNLGASRTATSSTDAEAYGDLYQWGRAADGHQKRNSGTTSTLSSGDTPGHGDFILESSSPYDWRSPQNNDLWQGVNGINNPCPPGYRLPTHAELNAERLSWSSNNSAGAFASPLKLPVASYRRCGDGSLDDLGSVGYYWSSTVDGVSSRSLGFSSSSAGMYNDYRAFGGSMRCLKDN